MVAYEVVVLLFLWKHCHAKCHKHNTSPHTALGKKGAHQPHPQPHPPPLYEEMGQILHSVVEDEAGVDCHGNQCYGILQQHGANKESITLSQPGTRQVNDKRSSKKRGFTDPHVSEADTAVEQLYANVESQVVYEDPDKESGAVYIAVN